MFERLPKDKPIAVLMRHAEREEIPANEFGNDVVLTESGREACVALAKKIPYAIRNLYSSPVKRCLQTAELFLPFSKAVVVVQSSLLGDPGIFIKNFEQVHQHFMRHTPAYIVRQLLNDQANPPGFCDSTELTVYQLINFLLTSSTQQGFSLFVTHDSILMVVLGILFTDIELNMLWPDYLNMLFVWREGNNLCLSYLEHDKKILWL